MKNNITLKMSSHDYGCPCPFTAECELFCNEMEMCKGSICPGELNEILGYGADWNCEIPISDQTALLIVSYFEIVSDGRTASESADIWAGFHLKTRICRGYEALKNRSKIKIPDRLHEFALSVIEEDAALEEAWKVANSIRD